MTFNDQKVNLVTYFNLENKINFVIEMCITEKLIFNGQNQAAFARVNICPPSAVDAGARTKTAQRRSVAKSVNTYFTANVEILTYNLQFHLKLTFIINMFE